MLYDPKWEVATKPDVFSLESLIAWLEKKQTKGGYDFGNCSGYCLFGQFTAAHGIPWSRAIGTEVVDFGVHALEFKKLVYSKVAGPTPRTFGAALKRARAALDAEER